MKRSRTSRLFVSPDYFVVVVHAFRADVGAEGHGQHSGYGKRWNRCGCAECGRRSEVTDVERGQTLSFA